jgi:HEAT repeat protein
MRKRVKIVFAAALLGIVGVLACELLHNREPVHRGKSLSYWLDRSATREVEAEAAVLNIGTNCIPTLLRKLQAKDPQLKVKLLELAEKQDFIDINCKTAEDEHVRAINGFRLLGDRAREAIGALTNLYAVGPPDLQERIAEALGAIGPSSKTAIPLLICGMDSTNAKVRESAASALWQIRSEPERVVPALMKALHDPVQPVQFNAIGGLACFGTNARAAIPALLSLAGDKNETVRSEIMDALRLTRGEPQVVVPVLATALTDSSPFVRGRAAYALGAFGTNAMPTIPLLLELAKETNDTVRDLAVISLGEIHSEPQVTVPALTKALRDPVDWIQANAAEGLGKFGTNAILAVPALVELYLNEQNRPPPTRADKPKTAVTIRESLLQIDPIAAAKAGVNTNAPGL